MDESIEPDYNSWYTQTDIEPGISFTSNNLIPNIYGEYSLPIHTSGVTWSMSDLECGEPYYSGEEVSDMNIEIAERRSPVSNEVIVVCKDRDDLEQDRILKCLSVMKAKLMLKCMPIHVKNIECKMTPIVKENIIKAYKKLQMYGKKAPFIARFDEYGRQLSDEIRIDTMKGMDIKIINPEDYGIFYIEFRGIVVEYPF